MSSVPVQGRKRNTKQKPIMTKKPKPPKNNHHSWWKSGIKKCCKPGFRTRIKLSIASCSPYWSSYIAYEGMDTCWLKSHFDVHSSVHYISRGCLLPDGCLGIHRLFLQNMERTSEIASLFPDNSLLLIAWKPSSGHKSKPLLPLETYSTSPWYRCLWRFSAYFIYRVIYHLVLKHYFISKGEK